MGFREMLYRQEARLLKGCLRPSAACNRLTIGAAVWHGWDVQRLQWKV